jgi:hypothetical protein
MSTKRLVLLLMSAAAIIAVLVASHWYAYSLGWRSGGAIWHEMQMDSSVERDQWFLTETMLALRLAAKHPEDLSSNEYQLLRAQLRNWTSSAETHSIPWLEKLGDQHRADFLRSLVQEAKELDSKLAKGPAQQKP